MTFRALGLLSVILYGAAPAPLFSEPRPAPRAAGALPLRFEANAGQADPRIRFIARGGGRTLALTATDVIVEPSATGVVRLRWLGADPHTAPTGIEMLPGRANYFIGSDPSKWQRDVATYGKVRYGQIYHGIDLVFYGTPQQLEYDFVVAPGADPSRIRLAVDGGRLALDEGGDAVLRAGDAIVRLRRPAIYQEIRGRRHDVPGGYRLSRGELRFRVGAYDRRYPLVIDPVLAYSTFFGGPAEDFATAIAVDAAGRIYVTGTTRSAQFPGTTGSQTTQYFPGNTPGTNQPAVGVAFVAKLDPTRTGPASLVYSTYLGGDPMGGSVGRELGYGIAVDATGDAYVTGVSASANFPVTPNAYQTIYASASEAFFTKLNVTGDRLLYSTYFGGIDSDRAYAIALDGAGRAVIAGSTQSANLPTTPGVIQPTIHGGMNAFIAKFDPGQSGAASLVFATFLGGSVSDGARGVALDQSGNIYAAGVTASSDFWTTASAFQSICVGCPPNTAFVTSLTSDASVMRYSTFLGGSQHPSEAHAIAVDASGQAYVAGTTEAWPAVSSTPFPVTAGAVQSVVIGQAAFLTKFDAAGGVLYSTFFGGATNPMTSAEGVAVDGQGHAHVVGYTSAADLPTTMDAIQPHWNGGLTHRTDAFVAEINPDPSSTTPLVFSTYFGGQGDEFNDASLSADGVAGIAVDAAGNEYIAGGTNSSAMLFPLTVTAYQSANAGGVDAFIGEIGKTSVTCSLTGIPGAWTATGAMATGRHANVSTATRLADGRVLVAGGVDASGFGIRATEIYDPGPGTFAASGGMTLPRAGHTSTLLPDGRVLLAGGTTNEVGECAHSAEIFDPAANAGAGSFVRTASMVYSRAHHTATLLPDGRVLLAGSQGAPCTGGASAEIFDPAANGGAGGFVGAGAISPRGEHTATLLGDGTVVLVAGIDPTTGLVLGTAAIFDPAASGGAGGWTLVASTLAPRVGHRATRLASGRVLVTGGVNTVTGTLSATAIFDPATAAFGPGPSLITPRLAHAAVMLANGQVLIAGGAGLLSGAGAFLDSAELFDETAAGGTGAFVATSLMTRPRLFPMAVPLANGSVLAIGGVAGAPALTLLTSAELYIPNNCTPFNTPQGANVSVQPIDTSTGQQPVAVTFSNVTQPGITSVTTTTAGPALPPNFALGAAGYYHIETTASFTGGITICIDYSGTPLAGTTVQPAFQHYDTALGLWTPVAVSSWDQANNVICGTVTSLSPFGLLRSTIPPPAIAITAPAATSYVLDAEVAAAYTCASAGSTITSCIGTVAVGAAIDTSTEGAHEFTVVATDALGRTTTASASYAVAGVEGVMIGDGRIDGPDERVHEFAFRIAERHQGVERGQLRYRVQTPPARTRKARTDTFESTSIGPIAFGEDPSFDPGRERRRGRVDAALVSGEGRWNGAPGYTFEARAADEGEPGRGRDEFALTVRDPHGVVVAEVRGTLSAGNIQANR